jgi:hypothetical protein
MNEVLGLLSSLLESWRQLPTSKPALSSEESAMSEAAVICAPEQEAGFSYGDYFLESAETMGREVYSF